jgi:predicted dehydrogenase
MGVTSILRVGIAGYGVVGKRRRQFIDLHPNMKTVAVCDRTFEGTGTFDDGVKFFRRYDELFADTLDVLFVCMTNDIAPEVTIAGLQSGLHVFCEKPPGRTVSDVERVIDCETQHRNLRLMYGFNHRYHDSVRDALEIVRSGELGSVLNMRGVYGKSKFISFGAHSDWRVKREIAGGGILLDQGIHMVDLMRLFGGEFEEIHSIVTNDFWKHDVEDNVYAMMRSTTGVVAMLHSSATQWRHRFNLEIALEKGAIVLSGILSGSKSYGSETMTIVWASEDDQGDPQERTRHYDHDPSWADEINAFAATILDGAPITNGTSTDALKTMELVFSIYRSDWAWAEKWHI